MSEGRRLLEAWLSADTGRSQSGLARAAGCSQTLICRLLSVPGRHPSLPIAVRLEQATGGAVPVASWARPAEVSEATA